MSRVNNMCMCLLITAILIMMPEKAQAAYQAVEVPITVLADAAELGTNQELSVTLKAEEGSFPMPGESSGQTKTVILKQGESVNFGNISFDEPGIYTYVVGKKSGDEIEENTSYKLTVMITNGSQAGQLTAQIIMTNQKTGQKSEKIDFSFAFSDQEKNSLIISKEVTGNAPKTEKFEFTVKFSGTGAEKSYRYFDMSGGYLGELASGDVIKLSGGERVQIEGMPNGLQYRVIETNKAYYTPNPLSGVREGTISSGANQAEFINSYNLQIPAPVSIDPPVEKQIQGETPNKDSVFTFELRPISANAPMPKGTTEGVNRLQITGAGSSDFGWITYTEPGLYEYTIYEVKGTESGYVYDETVYQMNVTVVNKDGRLTANKQLVKQDRSLADKIVFVNQYYAKKAAGSTISQILDQVKTGDTFTLASILIPMAVAVILIVLVMVIRRRQKENHGKDD